MRTAAAVDVACERAWHTVDSRATRAVASYATELRPVWWCIRAQVAFWTWQTAMGGQNAITLTPWGTAADVAVWTILMVLSIHVGRRHRDRPTASRSLGLLAVNSGALVALPYFLDRLESVM